MDFTLPVADPSGSALAQDATRHTVASHTAAATVARRRRRSILMQLTLSSAAAPCFHNSACTGIFPAWFGFILCGIGQKWCHDQQSLFLG
ncbi:Uncharacterised protein [Mycobacterium tuberculosis]|uniref:Uncharacterized protein n=1 Tax=Mycobacterium tuberculosis TaxID=1773 RepID=A0A0U0U0H4_MYCTX|nr:Uncharacterised protein [Mycobacterium tuberculosis]COY32178.1 Uncharacterised protein [Mycobacterium tuberculosis]